MLHREGRGPSTALVPRCGTRSAGRATRIRGAARAGSAGEIAAAHESLARCLALGAARCYFTGSDTHFALEGARAARARAELADSQATRLVTPSP